MVIRALLLLPCLGCLVEPKPPACRLPGALPNASETPDVDTDPWLSEDRLELLHASMYHRSTIDLFRATRASVDAPFDDAVPIVELATAATESGPFITDDGRTIWFARGPDDMNLALFTAMRPDRSQPFGAATEVTTLGEGGHPSLTSDGLAIYFERYEGNNTYNIYTATRSTATALEFSTPTRVEELVTGFSTGDPSISGDGSLIYYTTYAVDQTRLLVVRAARGPDGRFEHFEPIPDIDTDTIGLAAAARLLRDNRTVVYAARTPTKDQDLYIYCE